jgi:putative CocE/NonD family hydrolase
VVQITVPAWVATALFGASLTTAAPVDTRPINVEKLLHQRVPMRDGIHLDTNVYHPAGAARYPAILIRTPYGKAADFPTAYSSFIQHGYAVVMQDVRGRYGSEGVFDALSQEGPDGYDTLNWIAAQPWSDGKVGMIGGSYLGIAQWQVALLNNPHLKAIFPVVSGSDDYLDRFYSPGGAMKLGHRLLWLSQNLTPAGVVKPKFGDYIGHLPLRTSDRAATSQTLPIYQTVLEHPTYDSFWKEHSVRENISRVRVPVFSVGGWYDNYVESDLEAFAALHKAGKPDDKHRIMIGPWPHNMSSPFSGVGFGNDSGAPIRAYQIAWFDHWLKGTPEEAAHYTAHYTPWAWHNVRAEVDEAPVHIFVMGVNRWRDEQEWPLARTRYTALYLASKGHANTGKGDGGLVWNFEKKAKPDQFTYDPRDPAPTMGGAVCCDPKVFPWGPMDQRPVEKRKDVLVYTSDPLKQDLEVTGPVRVLLYASTTAPDTDFTAKLIDVFPSGEARNLTDGLLRVRYRHGLDKAEPADPGEIYPLNIDAGVTSNVFLAGHRIRVEISSSNFPRFDRNPNTGRTLADETILKKAQQTIYHSRMYPSRVLLPVVPELTSPATARYGAKRSPSSPATGLTFQAR